MPMIDGVKVSFEFGVVRESMLANSASAVQFSCSPCIRGHRSAHCPDTHSDRPLVEVKSECQIFFSKLTYRPARLTAMKDNQGKDGRSHSARLVEMQEKRKLFMGNATAKGKPNVSFVTVTNARLSLLD